MRPKARLTFRSLLRAKATFIREGYINGPDYDECLCRATACEVLARRIIHNLPPDRLENVMSTRFKYRERDGDESPPTSALETAIDQHCTVRSYRPVHQRNRADPLADLPVIV